MGGGMIVDGAVYSGSKNNAAMVFGMVNSFEPGKTDLAGISTSFAMLLYQYAMARQLPPGSVTGEAFFEKHAAGDSVAVALLSGYCRSVALSVYNSFMLLDPDCVVVTGGLAARDEVIDGINRSLAEVVASFGADPQVNMLLSVADVDMDDFHISVKRGELLLDANLYGAFFAVK